MKEPAPVDITVIIPCYNDGIYINDAVNSVLHQSLLPEKIIIIDDGSDEDTLQILKKIQSPLVQIIYQENTGVCGARNRAIKEATTSLILTLDADDYFEQTFIEKAYQVISTQEKIGVVCSYYEGFRTNGALTAVIKPLGGQVHNFLVQNNGVASALFRKSCWEAVNGYDVSFDKGYEDWDFWISILKNDWEMHVIPELLFKYRIKDKSRDQIAVALYNKELKMKIYDKHKDVYLEYIDRVYAQLIFKNQESMKNIVKLKNSKEYVLGNFILSPLKYFKNKLNS
ncbi:glycosyltransferase family 2 protein [Dokdonia sp. Dokd-P16]|uniref:glycosyltransferase family 2 protein n=1 Tax=Dokdonia sp. Dokd-P16 TaxID=2173169 RepID=UPI0013A57C9C|nr:glycosyltransferase family A protein [Dokdonia sp. Dokd-P16]